MDRMWPRGRLRLALVVAMLALVYSADVVARAFLPVLLRDHPLLLVSLNPNTHDVLLAGLKLPVAGLVAVAVTRRFTAHFVYYLVGLWYGEVTLTWLRKKGPLTAYALEKVEEIFRKFAKPAVFLLSDDAVCVLAGATGMPVIQFAVLHLAGTVLHIFILVLILQHAHGPLARIVTFIDGEVTPLTIIFVVVTVIVVVLGAVRHRHVLRDLIAAWKSRGESGSAADDPPDGNGE